MGGLIHIHTYLPTLSASSVLDILCHPSSTYHQSKAARPYIDISPKHGSKTAEQPDSKAANPWRQSGKAAKQQGKSGAEAGQVARQQHSRTARKLIHASEI